MQEESSSLLVNPVVRKANAQRQTMAAYICMWIDRVVKKLVVTNEVKVEIHRRFADNRGWSIETSSSIAAIFYDHIKATCQNHRQFMKQMSGGEQQVSTVFNQVLTQFKPNSSNKGMEKMYQSWGQIFRMAYLSLCKLHSQLVRLWCIFQECAKVKDKSIETFQPEFREQILNNFIDFEKLRGREAIQKCVTNFQAWETATLEELTRSGDRAYGETQTSKESNVKIEETKEGNTEIHQTSNNLDQLLQVKSENQIEEKVQKIEDKDEFSSRSEGDGLDNSERKVEMLKMLSSSLSKTNSKLQSLRKETEVSVKSSSSNFAQPKQKPKVKFQRYDGEPEFQDPLARYSRKREDFSSDYKDGPLDVYDLSSQIQLGDKLPIMGKIQRIQRNLRYLYPPYFPQKRSERTTLSRWRQSVEADRDKLNKQFETLSKNREYSKGLLICMKEAKLYTRSACSCPQNGQVYRRMKKYVEQLEAVSQTRRGREKREQKVEMKVEEQREQEQEQQGEEGEVEMSRRQKKLRRKQARNLQMQQQEVAKSQKPHLCEQQTALCNFLDSLTIDDLSRVPCRISEPQILNWSTRTASLRQLKNIRPSILPPSPKKKRGK